MSTKIYNGYIIPVESVYDLNILYKKLNDKLRKDSKEYFAKILSEFYLSIMVKAISGNDYIDGKDISNLNVSNISPDEAVKLASFLAYNEVKLYTNSETNVVKFNYLTKSPDLKNGGNAEKICIGTKPECFIVDSLIIDSELDFNVSISMLPIKDKLLSLVFCNNPFFKDIVELFNFEDYSYWDNTDKPENIPQEDWEQRKKDWDEALPGIGIPSENGFTMAFNLLDKIRPVVSYNKTIKPNLPSKSKIAEKIIKNNKYTEIFNKNYLNTQDYFKSHELAKNFIKCMYINNTDTVEKQIENFTPVDDIFLDNRTKYAYSFSSV